MALTLYRCLNKKTTKKKFHCFGMKLLFHKSLNLKLSSERLNTHALFSLKKIKQSYAVRMLVGTLEDISIRGKKIIFKEKIFCVV